MPSGRFVSSSRSSPSVSGALPFQIIETPVRSTPGSGFNIRALTMLKNAVLAAIPSASVVTATIVKPGVRRSCRHAYRNGLIGTAIGSGPAGL